MLKNERQTVIVPAPVLGEFLMRIPPHEHEKAVRSIKSNFIVPSFDTPATSVYAQIWQRNKNNGMPSENSSRERVKTDSIIIAIAVVNKASFLYSEDEGLQKAAKGFIETRSIPIIPRHMELGE